MLPTHSSFTINFFWISCKKSFWNCVVLSKYNSLLEQNRTWIQNHDSVDRFRGPNENYFCDYVHWDKTDYSRNPVSLMQKNFSLKQRLKSLLQWLGSLINSRQIFLKPKWKQIDSSLCWKSLQFRRPEMIKS